MSSESTETLSAEQQKLKVSKVSLLETTVNRIITYVNVLGQAILVVMMLFTAADVLLRYVFNKPITGGIELTEFMMAIVVAIALAYTAVRKGHIATDFVILKLPPRTGAVINSVTCLASIGVFALITWWSLIYAGNLRASEAVSSNWYIPVYPFVYIFALGSAVICLILILNLVQYLAQVTAETRNRIRVALLVVVVLALALLALPIWGSGLVPRIHPLTAGFIGVIAMVIILFLGMAVATTMALAGFLGMVYISGVNAGFIMMGTSPYATSSAYNNSVIPLFVLMGAFCFYAGLSRDLYYAAYKWFGHLPGGLAMATVGACAAFAAVSGSSVATASTMGTVALPEMKKYKYDAALATGCVAAGGTLGILIPPSVPMVIYGIITEQSIGKLFLAGFIPGIIVAAVYILTIYFVCKRNPLLGLPGPSSTLKEKLVSVKGTWAVLVLFLLVIGGLYLGVFTATEAAGVGAFGAFLFAVGTRRLSWHGFKASLVESMETSGMSIFILIGGVIFGYFLAVTRVPFELANLVSSWEVNRYFILLGVIFVYLFLGCIMSALAMIIITVPVFFPIITTLGFDPIWFGIIITRLVEVGQITPPVGVSVFVIKGVSKDVPLYTVFRGIIPFLISDVFIFILLIALPEVVLFLPNLMD